MSKTFRSGFSKKNYAKNRNSLHKLSLNGKVSTKRYHRKSSPQVWWDDDSGSPNRKYISRLVKKFVGQPLQNLLKILDTDKTYQGKLFKECALQSIYLNNEVTKVGKHYHSNRFRHSANIFPLETGTLFVCDKGYLRAAK